MQMINLTIETIDYGNHRFQFSGKSSEDAENILNTKLESWGIYWKFLYKGKIITTFKEFTDVVTISAVEKYAPKGEGQKRINNVRILLRNVFECNLCASHNISSSDRTRYNRTITPTPTAPDTAYLAKVKSLKK